MRRLLCLLGLHHYRKPTHIGGMRCQCGRVRYHLQWWAPATGGQNGTGTQHALTLAHLAELGLVGDGTGPSGGRRGDGPVNIMILPLARDDGMHRLSTPALPPPGGGRAIAARHPADRERIQDAHQDGLSST